MLDILRRVRLSLAIHVLQEHLQVRKVVQEVVYLPSGLHHSLTGDSVAVCSMPSDLHGVYPVCLQVLAPCVCHAAVPVLGAPAPGTSLKRDQHRVGAFVIPFFHNIFSFTKNWIYHYILLACACLACLACLAYACLAYACLACGLCHLLCLRLVLLVLRLVLRRLLCRVLATAAALVRGNGLPRRAQALDVAGRLEQCIKRRRKGQVMRRAVLADDSRRPAADAGGDALARPACTLGTEDGCTPGLLRRHLFAAVADDLASDSVKGLAAVSAILFHDKPSFLPSQQTASPKIFACPMGQV